MGRLKTLIHVHTDYSFDSDISLSCLMKGAANAGLDCVAVTDHDTIGGALHLRDEAPFKVIVGEEVSTKEGHLIGLFLKERIPPGMSVRETAEAIRGQGGLVLVPHPFTKAFGCGLGEATMDIIDYIDAVEVNNAQNASPTPDLKAMDFAREHRLVSYVGADSHLAISVAPCWQRIDPFESPASFLRSLARAKLSFGRHPASYFARMGWRIARHVASQGLGRVDVCAPLPNEASA